MNDEKIKEVKKWIEYANEDLYTAIDELGKRKPWIITFHAQQAIEKYLKAFLTFHEIKFRKTHNIFELLKLCTNIDKDFENLLKLDLSRFGEYATIARYPEFEFEISEEEAKEAIEIAEKVKEFVLNKLKEKGLE